MSLRVAVVDDAGFGLAGGKGVFGKEVYSELLARINEQYMENKVYRVLLGTGFSETIKIHKFVGSKTPLVRVFIDKKLTDSLARFLEKNKIDIVHANILNPRYVIPLINAVKQSKTRLVYTVHSYIPLCPLNWKTYIPEMKPCTYRYPGTRCIKCIYEWRRRFNEPVAKILRGLLQITLIRKIMREAHAIISPSMRFMELARRELDLDSEKIHFIPNPINPELLEKEAGEAEGYAFYIGRLEYEKGAHLLPEIARLIAPMKLHVAGQGRLEKYIKETAPHNLVFHGYVDKNRKDALYRGASVVVVPSIWMEMFGYTVVEAFSYMKPVVAFSHAGPGELIQMSGGGLLAEPFDINRLADNIRRIIEEGLVYKLGARGRAFVEKELHPSKYASELERIYTKILSKNPG